MKGDPVKKGQAQADGTTRRLCVEEAHAHEAESGSSIRSALETDEAAGAEGPLPIEWRHGRMYISRPPDPEGELPAEPLPLVTAAEPLLEIGPLPSRWRGRKSSETKLRKSASEPPLSAWRPPPTMEAAGRYGRYELLGRLARGGMAEILLARERTVGDSHRVLVVKRILPAAAGDAQFVRMLLDEGRLVMGLTHPGICHVYDVGCEDETWFIAMEWVNGAPLSRVIKRARGSGGVPSPIAARVIAQVADALHHAHRARDQHGTPLHIVHRDVSPQNILVGYDGTVKLLDFGIAKAIDNFDETRAGVVKGKYAYMAPEQCLKRTVDARTDVFALGICLWEALAGQTLFRRKTEFETIDALLHDEPPSLRSLDPDLPIALDAIALRALQKKPSDRFQSAAEMQLALEEHLAKGGHVVNTARVETLMRGLFAEEIRDGPVLEPIEGEGGPGKDEESGLISEAGNERPTARPRAPQLPDDEREWTPLSERRSRRRGRRLLLFLAALLIALFALAEGDLFGQVPSPQPAGHGHGRGHGGAP